MMFFERLLQTRIKWLLVLSAMGPAALAFSYIALMVIETDTARDSIFYVEALCAGAAALAVLGACIVTFIKKILQKQFGWKDVAYIVAAGVSTTLTFFLTVLAGLLLVGFA
jgi:hypothetical protein